MDYHAESLLANAEKDKAKAEPKKEAIEPEDGIDTNRTE